MGLRKSWWIICCLGFAAASSCEPVEVLGVDELDSDDPDTETGETDEDDDGFADDDDDDDGSSTDENDGQTDVLTGVVRDFHDSHIDFEHPDFNQGDKTDKGIVEKELGDDGKPVYAGGTAGTTHGKTAFDQWYRDVPGVNEATTFSIQLTESDGGVYTYDNQEFFPIDNELFGNEDRPHNYHYTFEIHTKFTYMGGEQFTFTGDDDLWVFINGHQVIDLGGVHMPQNAVADLDTMAEELEIKEGREYTLDLFFAERHVTMSTFRIDTTIEDLEPVVVE